MSLLHSTDVWFDDGNIVLQAEQTLFKIYRGVLQAQSPLFRDLLALPQPENSDGSEEYEDCPLVVLYDAAKDVGLFLKAIFDPQFYTDVRAITDYTVFGSMMRMGTKYQVDFLVRRCLPVFTAVYPATLGKWQGREARRQFKPLRALYGRALPFVVIEVAREIGMDALLPAAYLECCSYPDVDIVGGIMMPDGTPMRLAPRDQVIILQGRAKLSELARTTIFGFVYDAQLVKKAQGSVIWQFLHDWVQSKWVGSWLDPFERDFPWLDYGKLTTRGVWQERQKFNARRLEAWKTLPATFGLLAWDKMKRVEMR